MQRNESTYRSPFWLHALQSLLQSVLLAGCLWDGFELGDVGVEIELDELRQTGRLVRFDGEAHDVRDMLPVALSQAGVKKRMNQRHVFFELLHFGFNLAKTYRSIH